MNRSGLHPFTSLLLGGLALFAVDSLHRKVQAQSQVDLSLGAESSVLNSQGMRDIVTGGAVRGGGLFHSFEQLNVAEGRSLYFIQPDGISKIFSRVTGSSPSNILGTLGVQKDGVQGNADLYLLNPNGILLGPNAQLELGGSFFASTADSLRFDGSDAEFDASSANAVPLLTLEVETGIQFVRNQPDRLLRNEAQILLQPGQALLLDGGTLEQAGQIRTQGETTLRSEGNVLIENAVLVNAPSTTLAEVNSGNLAPLNGSANTLGDGGNIRIDAGFVIAPPTENSDITADAFEGTGGNVTITTDGVFGIQRQDADTPNSDITASSELGIAGAVRIDRLASSPADALARLPDRLLKPEDAITQGCPSDQNARFVITGRGGLPANSQQRLLRNPVLEDWREQPPNPSIRTALRPVSPSMLGRRSSPREAQGLQRDRKGSIHLVLNQLQDQENDQGSTVANCRGGQAG